MNEQTLKHIISLDDINTDFLFKNFEVLINDDYINKKFILEHDDLEINLPNKTINVEVRNLKYQTIKIKYNYDNGETLGTIKIDNCTSENLHLSTIFRKIQLNKFLLINSYSKNIFVQDIKINTTNLDVDSLNSLFVRNCDFGHFILSASFINKIEINNTNFKNFDLSAPLHLLENRKDLLIVNNLIIHNLDGLDNFSILNSDIKKFILHFTEDFSKKSFLICENSKIKGKIEPNQCRILMALNSEFVDIEINNGSNVDTVDIISDKVNLKINNCVLEGNISIDSKYEKFDSNLKCEIITSKFNKMLSVREFRISKFNIIGSYLNHSYNYFENIVFMNPHGELDFLGTNFINLSFVDTNFENCIFKNIDFENTQFENCVWEEQNIQTFSSINNMISIKQSENDLNKLIFEEKLSELMKLQNSYNKLGLNFKKRSNYVMFSKFYIAEQETKFQLEQFQKQNSIYSLILKLHRYISHYGQSIELPLKWMAITTLAFAFIFSGFVYNNFNYNQYLCGSKHLEFYNFPLMFKIFIRGLEISINNAIILRDGVFNIDKTLLDNRLFMWVVFINKTIMFFFATSVVRAFVNFIKK